MSVPVEPRPHIPPVYTPQLHNETMQALSVFLMQVDMLGRATEADVAPLRRCADAMADALIEGIGTAYETAQQVPLRDHQYAHPVKVAELAMILAKLAGAGRAQLRNTGLAALVMNLGYATLRQGTIERAGPLGEAEWGQLREHPAASVRLLDDSGLSDESLTAIGQHHERWNGSGYPGQLRGKEITIYARIIAVADCYVALCSPRFHRPARPRLAVEEYFSLDAGTLFDPSVVRLLLEELPRRYHHPD